MPVKYVTMPHTGATHVTLGFAALIVPQAQS
jgi:hypothetical protein